MASKMKNKIKSYIVKAGAELDVVRIEYGKKNRPYLCTVAKQVTSNMFGFDSWYMMTKRKCMCCGEVSYIFKHMDLGPVAIKEKDLILTSLSIEDWYKSKGLDFNEAL